MIALPTLIRPLQSGDQIAWSGASVPIGAIILIVLSFFSPICTYAQDNDCDVILRLKLRMAPPIPDTVTISETKGYVIEFVVRQIVSNPKPVLATITILRRTGTTDSADEVHKWEAVLERETLTRNLKAIPAEKRKAGDYQLGVRRECDSDYAHTIDLFKIKYVEQSNEEET